MNKENWKSLSQLFVFLFLTVAIFRPLKLALESEKHIVFATIETQDVPGESEEVGNATESAKLAPRPAFGWGDAILLIARTFGPDAEVAVAVTQVECNYTRRDWPRCVNTSPVEHSVGMFQINLAKDYGNGTRVHWEKVPGDNLQEKEEWLKDPVHNVLIAKQIFDESGWYPWAGYTSGAYIEKLSGE